MLRMALMNVELFAQCLLTGYCRPRWSLYDLSRAGAQGRADTLGGVPHLKDVFSVC